MLLQVVQMDESHSRLFYRALRSLADLQERAIPDFNEVECSAWPEVARTQVFRCVCIDDTQCPSRVERNGQRFRRADIAHRSSSSHKSAVGSSAAQGGSAPKLPSRRHRPSRMLLAVIRVGGCSIPDRTTTGCSGGHSLQRYSCYSLARLAFPQTQSVARQEAFVGEG